MKPISKLVLVVLVAACSLLMWSSTDLDQSAPYRFPLASFATNSNLLERPLAMTFAHADHSKQQCATCHHNYLDDTGQGLCIDCHRTNHEIAFRMRQQFHDLCMGCHIDKRSEGEQSGPLRNCKACHTEDHAP